MAARRSDGSEWQRYRDGHRLSLIPKRNNIPTAAITE
jgi:hypothetical protein